MKTSDIKTAQFHFYLQTLFSHHEYLYSANIYFWRIDDHVNIMAECGNCGIKMNCGHTHPSYPAPDFTKEVEVGTSLSENS